MALPIGTWWVDTADAARGLPVATAKCPMCTGQLSQQIMTQPQTPRVCSVKKSALLLECSSSNNINPT